MNSNNKLKYLNFVLFSIFAFTSVYIHTASIPAEPAVPHEKYIYNVIFLIKINLLNKNEML